MQAGTASPLTCITPSVRDAARSIMAISASSVRRIRPPAQREENGNPCRASGNGAFFGEVPVQQTKSPDRRTRAQGFAPQEYYCSNGGSRAEIPSNIRRV